MNFELTLKKAGYKITNPRRAVIEVLKNHGEHLSHKQILAEGRKNCPRLGRATVYRTMELLVGLHLVRPLYLNDATQRFIVATAGHHHFICTECGRVIEFGDCIADELLRNFSKTYHFQIQSHLLEFWGICDACQHNFRN